MLTIKQEHHEVHILFKVFLCLLFATGCSKSFDVNNAATSTSQSTSQDVNPWSQGIPGPISTSDPLQPQPAGTYCALYIPADTFTRDKEFRIVVLSKDVVRVEVSVNHSSYVSLNTSYGELKWPGNTFDVGQYNLVFRGISTSGGIISCDPASKEVTIQPVAPPPVPSVPNPPTMPMPTPVPPGPAPIGSTKDYATIIGTGAYSNFKTTYSPATLSGSSTSNEVTLRTRHMGLAHSRIKIFIPPGVKKFLTSIVTYRVDQPARAAARFKSPPVSLVSDIVPDLSGGDSANVLKNLQAGQELRFYSPENSGVLTMSNSSSDGVYRGAEGGYIYINFFNIPGEKFLSFDTVLKVDKDCYQRWYNSITWDSQGNPREGDIHTCN